MLIPVKPWDNWPNKKKRSAPGLLSEMVRRFLVISLLSTSLRGIINDIKNAIVHEEEYKEKTSSK